MQSDYKPKIHEMILSFPFQTFSKERKYGTGMWNIFLQMFTKFTYSEYLLSTYWNIFISEG